MVAVLCFIKKEREEFVIIGWPYSDLIKSFMSWVIVVTPSQYFLALLVMPKRKEAPSSDFISHQASSTTKILFLSSDLTWFQMYLVIIYMAMGLNPSSISLIPKTTRLFFMFTLDGWLKKSAYVPLVNFLILLTRASAPSIVSKTCSRSDINGGSMLEKSESEVMSFDA